MIGIINTGIGNIPSVLSALKKIEKDTLLCTNKNDLDKVKKNYFTWSWFFQSF